MVVTTDREQTCSAGNQRPARRLSMTEHVYKTIELTGASKVGIDDAVKKAVAKAAKTLHNLRWFQITEIRGNVDGGAVSNWQVSLKVGFTLDD
jgi:flavin-binding protein dodecin